MRALARARVASTSSRAAPARAPAAGQWRLPRGRRAAAVRVVAFTEDKVVTATDVVVKLSIPYKTAFGQALKAVGSPSSLGAWNVKDALPLEWSTGDVWQGELRLPAGLYEFKVVVVDSVGQVQWESCANRALEVPATPGLLEVPCTWNSHLLDPRFTTTTTTTDAAEQEPSLATVAAAAAPLSPPAIVAAPAPPTAAADLVAPLSAALAAEPPPPPPPPAPLPTVVEEVAVAAAAAAALVDTAAAPAPPEFVPALDATLPTAAATLPSLAATAAAAPAAPGVLDLIEEAAAAAAPPPLEVLPASSVEEPPRAPAAMTPLMGSLEVVAAEADLAAAPLQPAPPEPAPAAPALAAEGAVAAAPPAPVEPPVVAEGPEAVVAGTNGTKRKAAAAAVAEGEAAAPRREEEQRQAVLAGGNGRGDPGAALPPGVPPALQELYASDSPAGKFVRFLVRGSWDS